MHVSPRSSLLELCILTGSGGYDIHTSTLTAVAENLAKASDRLQGTLILLFQPDEETANDARAMLEDGLYGQKYGTPILDIILSQYF